VQGVAGVAHVANLGKQQYTMQADNSSQATTWQEAGAIFSFSSFSLSSNSPFSTNSSFSSNNSLLL
jgi:hypothetical protein